MIKNMAFTVTGLVYWFCQLHHISDCLNVSEMLPDSYIMIVGNAIVNLALYYNKEISICP